MAQKTKVAFDTWVLGPGALHHGVNIYASQLLRHFQRLAPEYLLEIVAYVANSNHDAAEISGGVRTQRTGLLNHNRLWRFGGASALASFGGTDLVFNPHCTTLYAGSAIPAVTTIHDAIPVVLPWSTRAARILRFLLWAAVKLSRAIITVSECSKSDLVRIYGVPESRVYVVYNGCDHGVFSAAAPDHAVLKQAREGMGITKPYIFHYGLIKPNKNLKRLILAYDGLLQRDRGLELDLVLAGAADSAFDEVADAARKIDTGRRGRVILTGALEQPELVLLLKGATLAVFPSLYEGFCMPMVESMACGVPTIAANSSCLPEISGAALRYFEPESVQDMSGCIEAVLKNEDLRRELSSKGRARAAQFDWGRCAQQTLAILSRVARGEAAPVIGGA